MAYNDRIDNGRRQDLYVYAAKVVGSRAPHDVQHARAERLNAWALELHWGPRLQRLVPARLRAFVQTTRHELVGSHAACAIPQHNWQTHAEVLALIDELLTIGACEQPTAQPLEKDGADAQRRQSPGTTVTAAPHGSADSCARRRPTRWDHHERRSAARGCAPACERQPGVAETHRSTDRTFHPERSPT